MVRRVTVSLIDPQITYRMIHDLMYAFVFFISKVTLNDKAFYIRYEFFLVVSTT